MKRKNNSGACFFSPLSLFLKFSTELFWGGKEWYVIAFGSVLCIGHHQMYTEHCNLLKLVWCHSAQDFWGEQCLHSDHLAPNDPSSHSTASYFTASSSYVSHGKKFIFMMAFIKKIKITVQCPFSKEVVWELKNYLNFESPSVLSWNLAAEILVSCKSTSS